VTAGSRWDTSDKKPPAPQLPDRPGAQLG
jgi:hypothetical protein